MKIVQLKSLNESEGKSFSEIEKILTDHLKSTPYKAYAEELIDIAYELCGYSTHEKLDGEQLNDLKKTLDKEAKSELELRIEKGFYDSNESKKSWLDEGQVYDGNLAFKHISDVIRQMNLVLDKIEDGDRFKSDTQTKFIYDALVDLKKRFEKLSPDILNEGFIDNVKNFFTGKKPHEVVDKSDPKAMIRFEFKYAYLNAEYAKKGIENLYAEANKLKIQDAENAQKLQNGLNEALPSLKSFIEKFKTLKNYFDNLK